MPNCSQRLSWPILWIVTVYTTYWTHTTAVCVLMVALTPTFGFPPTPQTLTTTHSLIQAICNITVTVKKLLKI